MRPCIGVMTGTHYPEHMFIVLAGGGLWCIQCATKESVLDEPSKVPTTNDDGSLEEVGL